MIYFWLGFLAATVIIAGAFSVAARMGYIKGDLADPHGD